MRKYNSALKGMVNNYRAEAKERDMPTDHLTDEQLFDLIEKWSGMSTGDETMEAVMEELAEMQGFTDK